MHVALQASALKALYGQGKASVLSSSLSAATSVQQLFVGMRPGLLCAVHSMTGLLWMLSLQLVELFGGVRDDWITSDLPSWLGANRIYQGVADPVREALAQQEVYIVTTKQQVVKIKYATLDHWGKLEVLESAQCIIILKKDVRVLAAAVCLLVIRLVMELQVPACDDIAACNAGGPAWHVRTSQGFARKANAAPLI
eukprot:scaffold56853_cov16-Tisochrysis_lutea.AAC.1